MTDLFTADAVAEILIGAEEGKKPLHYRVGDDGVILGVSGWENEKVGTKSTPSEKPRIEVLENSNEALRVRLQEGVDMVAGLCNNIEDAEPRLRRAIGFLASAVKCGEPWTDEAQRVFDDSLAVLDRLVGTSPPAGEPSVDP